METERITLSQRERDRLKVLHEVQQKHFSQVAAAERLKLTDRHVRRMLMRICERGDSGMVHGLRGRPSNRKLAAACTEVLALSPALCGLRAYAGGRTPGPGWFAGEPRNAAEMDDPGGFVAAAPPRVKAVHVWRERRACFGELVMQDSSPFRWLEDRGPACQLIALIDDATSRIWGRFAEHDTTEENMRTLEGWLRRYGRPLAHYTDKASIFRTAVPQRLPNNSVEILRERSLGVR